MLKSLFLLVSSKVSPVFSPPSVRPSSRDRFSLSDLGTDLVFRSIVEGVSLKLPFLIS